MAKKIWLTSLYLEIIFIDMGLKEVKDLPYLVGRAIAIVEHYGGKKFGPRTKSTMFETPAYPISVFAKYVDADDVYWRELCEMEIEFPGHLIPVQQSQAWIGYYHQKAKYGDESTTRVDIGGQLADLRKKKGLQQEEVAERSGVIRTTISKVEQGKFSAGIDLIGRIAEALDAEVKIVGKENRE